MNKQENKQTVNPGEFVITEELTIDPDELNHAEKKAAVSDYVFIRKFSSPVSYNNNVISEMTFDWSTLTGQDSLDIENELQLLGKMLVTPAFSGEFIIRMAALVSSPRVGADFFKRLPLLEYNSIRSAGRSFLLKSE